MEVCGSELEGVLGVGEVGVSSREEFEGEDERAPDGMNAGVAHFSSVTSGGWGIGLAGCGRGS